MSLLEKYLLKRFRVCESYYIFEGNTSNIHEISKDIYDMLPYFCYDEKEFINKNIINYVKGEKLLVHKEITKFIENNLTDVDLLNKDKIFRKSLKFYRSFLPKPKNFVVVLTADCNLRCKYCIYGSNYEFTRNLEKKVIDIDNVKKQIDKFHQFNNNGTISFYGGEPLLEFNKMKKIIEYCEVRNYNFSFSMTTNGTLLNKRIIDYLVEKKINLAVSLDVDREIHDRNRIFINGRGSYNIIKKNIDYIKNVNEKYYIKKLTILVTVNNMEDEIKAIEFKKNSLPRVIINNVQETEKEMKMNYFKAVGKRHLYKEWKEKVKKENDESLFNYRENFENFTKESFKIGMLSSYDKKITSRLYSFYKRHNNEEIINIGGTCVPIGGNSRVLLNYDGVFYPCEKLDYNYPISRKHCWVSKKMVDHLLQEILTFKTKYCINCWIKNICSLCFASFVVNEKIKKNYTLCHFERENAMMRIMHYTYMLKKYDEGTIGRNLSYLYTLGNN